MRPLFINQKYSVIFDEYAEKHYIKDFEKKYKTRWEITRQSIIDTLERLANLVETNYLDVICNSNSSSCLAKFDFKIAKTNVSPKTSGNRCILEICNQKPEVRVLLVYCKDHIDRPTGQETVWWKEIVKNQFGLDCC